MDNVKSRFWSKVQMSPTPPCCWEWTGSAGQYGHGRFKVNGDIVSPHRLVWEWMNGPIDDGLCVCHRCDNPRCVRPSHLFLGTLSDNMQDAADKGRLFNPNVKLSIAEVWEIRARYRRFGRGINGSESLAKEFGVDPSTIRRVARHLPHYVARESS